MDIKDVFIIGIALAMDALGVTLSIGLSKGVSRSRKIAFIISFGFFQFLFFFIGGVGGFLFEKYITAIPNLIGGIAIFIVGVLMVKEGFDGEYEEVGLLIKNYMLVVLGVSVSIDALVIGFTSFKDGAQYGVITLDSILIGLITLIICTTGFYICRYIRKINFIARYADFFGGIILIIFAMKMIFL